MLCDLSRIAMAIRSLAGSEGEGGGRRFVSAGLSQRHLVSWPESAAGSRQISSRIRRKQSV